jgi:uracil-DNA glycosylase family protein
VKSPTTRTDSAGGSPAAEPPPRTVGVDAAQYLRSLQDEAESCTRCDLYARAEHLVFGEGSPEARMVLVGEQPGDHEDQDGRPFVGPAGRLLNEALEAAGINRDEVYVTNAVKHFKWIPRGKKRIHQRPNGREIRACSAWLHGELDAIEPDVLVCMGAVAAQALLGSDFKVTQSRGKPIESPLAPSVLATVHPSSILREPDAAARHAAFEAFVQDLKTAKRLMDNNPPR